jgi:undecaprenyl-diphosphatase
MGQLLMYIFYGLVAGFSQFAPVSASAHQALFPMLLRFDSGWPMLRLFVHGGALVALIFLYRERLTHIYREMQIVTLPARQRNRPPDMDAVLDASISMMAVIPMLIGAIVSAFLPHDGARLLPMSICLMLGAVLIYVPDFVPGGDRKTGAMTRAEGVLLGICAALSIIPGLSRVGLMISLGLLLKCDRHYICELILLICGVMLAELMLIDLISIFVTGFSGFTILRFLGCILAAFASFGGGVGAIMMMRHLAVKTGFSGFAFYGWSLGLFSFILYLMV